MRCRARLLCGLLRVHNVGLDMVLEKSCVFLLCGLRCVLNVWCSVRQQVCFIVGVDAVF